MFKLGHTRGSISPLLGLLAAGLAVAPALAQTAVSSGFTYQGRLNLSGQPVDGAADLQFTLFDAATAGNAVAATQTVLDADVVDGLFTNPLWDARRETCRAARERADCGIQQLRTPEPRSSHGLLSDSRSGQEARSRDGDAAA